MHLDNRMANSQPQAHTIFFSSIEGIKQMIFYLIANSWPGVFNLDKNNLTKNTIVIYVSDQGFYMGEHGWFDKRWIFEESVRTPLLVRWPGVTKPGSVSKALVSNLDYAQTFLAMARQTGPRRQLVDVADLIEAALELTTYGLRTSDITWNARTLAKHIQIEVA